jgi:hypothetical protein
LAWILAALKGVLQSALSGVLDPKTTVWHLLVLGVHEWCPFFTVVHALERKENGVAKTNKLKGSTACFIKKKPIQLSLSFNI